MKLLLVAAVIYLVVYAVCRRAHLCHGRERQRLATLEALIWEEDCAREDYLDTVDLNVRGCNVSEAEKEAGKRLTAAQVAVIRERQRLEGLKTS